MGSPHARWLIAALACVLSTGIIFRLQILNGFSSTFGDVVDGRIEIALLEHWFNVFRGLEAWRQPLFLFPTPNTLGLNDGYFLYGVIYAFWRAVGLDPFLAAELVNVVVKIIGFAGFLLVAQEACGVRFGWAVLGAALFTLSNGSFQQLGHVQLLTVAFAPVLAWLAWRAGVALAQHRAGPAFAWGCVAAILLDAWLLTAFYTAWFTAFFTAILALCALPGTKRHWRSFLTLPRWPVVGILLVLAAGTVPFLMVYLPVLHTNGMHSAATALAIVPRLFDLINVGDGNLVYGRLNAWMRHMIWPSPYRLQEFSIGWPLAGLALAAFGIFAAWTARPHPMLWRALSVAVVVSLAVSVQVDGHTFWFYVYEVIPAAAAIRVVARFDLFLAFPVTLLTIYGLARIAPLVPAPLLGLVICGLLAEQVNVGHEDHVPRTQELMFLAAIPPVPSSCKAFAVTIPRTIDDRVATEDLFPYVRSVDAMLIAELIHLPTLNGHATLLPPDFRLGPADGDVTRQVRAAAAAYHLTQAVCGLDLANMQWIPAPLPAPNLPLGRTLLLERTGDAAAYLMDGWSGGEDTGRWTNGAVSSLGFAVPLPVRDLDITLVAQPFMVGGGPGPITVSADGHTIATWTVVAGSQSLHAILPAASIASNGTISLVLTIANPHRPSDAVPAGQPATTDGRLLGLFVHSLLVTAAAP